MRLHNFYFELVGSDGRTIDGRFLECSRNQAKRLTHRILRHKPAVACVNSYQEFGATLYSAERK